MNEEQLADILAGQLDAALAGSELATAPPDELSPLLQVGQKLAEAAPAPRPEFGPALRRSLLESLPASSPAASPDSTAALGKPFGLIVVISLAVLVTLALLLGVILVSVTGPSAGDASATPPATAVQTVPRLPAGATTQATINAEPGATVTAAATGPGQASDTIPSPVSTPTAVYDKLPAITVTVQIENSRSPSPGIVPGADNNDQRDSDANSGGSSSGSDDDDDN